MLKEEEKKPKENSTEKPDPNVQFPASEKLEERKNAKKNKQKTITEDTKK